MRCGGPSDRTVDPPCTLQPAGFPLPFGGRNRGVKQAIPQNRTDSANLQDLSLRDMRIASIKPLPNASGCLK